MKIKKYLGLVSAVAVLAACNGVTEPELPAERPYSSVSGYVVDDPVSGATISVYAFDEGRQGELLATSSMTAADGAYSLQLQSKDRPVLIEARGGAFTDLVNGAHIDVDSDQVLRAVAMYRSGEPLSLMVTPLTHIAAGLAEYKAAHGAAASDAVAQANSDISKLFQVDITNTHPFSINDTSAKDRDGQFYGFYLAAMSSWADWATKRGNAAPGAVFSTMELAQIIYNDIQADGKLDGVGANANGQSMALAFAGQPLNSSVYRLDLAQHMVTLAASDKNATGIVMSDLLPRAKALLEDGGGLVPSEAPTLDGKVTLTSLVRENWYYNGELNFNVMPSEAIVLKEVQFYVDGELIGNAVDPSHASIKIATTGYVDGDHKVRAVATDMLGNEIEKTFLLKFDNNGPNLNPNPVAVTNLNLITLAGGYIENGAALSSIKIGNQLATLDIAKKTWSVDKVPLIKGKNSIITVVTDVIGNQVTSKIDVLVDQEAPEILATAQGHGEARFLDGNGVVTSRLLTDANAESVYFEPDKVGLRGTTIARSNLKANLIPYFAFKVNDPTFFGVGSVPDKISVSLQIEKGGAVMSPWTPLTMVNGEYLLPLATEKLYATWLKLTPNDEIYLRVKAVDGAGNPSKEKLFTFKPNFVVPVNALRTIQVVDEIWSQFDSVGGDFGRRGELHGQSFVAVKYYLENSSGRDFYISPDSGLATVRRDFSEIIREHKVKRKTEELWRAGFYDLSAYQCPPEPPAVVNISVIYNYSGVAWQLETLPGAILEEIQVMQDTLPPPDLGVWAVPADTDVFVTDLPDGSHVELDYSISPPDLNGDVTSAAWVKAWQFPNADPVQDCTGMSLFQKKTEITYSELTGPVNKVVSGPVSETTQFASDSYKVLDNGNEITPLNGWYKIPANHSVTVERTVHAPVVSVAPSDAALDAIGGGYGTSSLFDQSLTWNISQPITVQVIHDAGDININSMTVRNNVVGSGAKTYQISR